MFKSVVIWGSLNSSGHPLEDLLRAGEAASNCSLPPLFSECLRGGGGGVLTSRFWPKTGSECFQPPEGIPRAREAACR